jgi:ABC-type Fe3+/spermidine/putrescine transport system ATPase subunit
MLRRRSAAENQEGRRCAKTTTIVISGPNDTAPRSISLARAFVAEPALLLLDEPLFNLDAALREEMRFDIREIQRRVGITTFFVTHDQMEALAISDQIAVMQKGRIVQIGTPEEIYRSPKDRCVAAFRGHASLNPAQVAGLGPRALLRHARRAGRART